MKIYVCMIPGDDIPIAGVSFDKRFCCDKYHERKAALESKYHLAVRSTLEECIHECDVDGTFVPLHLAIAGYNEDQLILGAVIGDEDRAIMQSMVDKFNDDTDDEDDPYYFHIEEIMLGLPDENKRDLNKYTVRFYKRIEWNNCRSHSSRFVTTSKQEFENLFRPWITKESYSDIDEFWKYGSSPYVHAFPGLCEIVMPDGNKVFRQEFAVYCYANTEEEAYDIASAALSEYLSKRTIESKSMEGDDD